MIDAQPISLPPLPYPAGALEPVLSEDQVLTHYEKHHAAYVTKANDLLARAGGLEGFGRSPGRTWQQYVFNVNGARLHELFWLTFVPGGRDLSFRLRDMLGSDLFSLKRDLVYEAAGIQGSGWACLSMGKRDGSLVVHQVPNHDYPWKDLEPLIVLDAWEHAYYVDYRNERQRYAEGLLTLVDWEVVERRLAGLR